MTMMRLRLIALLLSLVCAIAPQAKPAEPIHSILFVGNSLTYVNNLPEVFRQFAAGSPLQAKVEVQAVAVGGYFLSDHWKRGEALATMRQQHPDLLILQGQSVEPLLANASFNSSGRLFKGEADRLQIRTILLGTWARPAGDPYYKDTTSGGSPPKMQRLLDMAYASLARQLHVAWVPAGIAFSRAEQSLPSIPVLDGTQHPSPAGTYLAAAVLYRVAFAEATASSEYYFNLPKETALSLQQVASEISIEP